MVNSHHNEDDFFKIKILIKLKLVELEPIANQLKRCFSTVPLSSKIHQSPQGDC